ncbi:hypothetical protein A3G56_02915 [Candidatus Falkowbacteria bacterium RIFCSPLOWO2_12_FULL_45_10]|uniref:Nucleotidyl transferase domain-containing protein n=1 Tax=Candidatus Falkowbacteria bacterium RIFCSPLOWO2_12_FULL_45_10 TaxID=1797990 RepID=A0A1F5RZ96_9BACT|nr:MAG: hypothetical protein A3G56_02915 [Candidatus Falkowbacteria bacterium RIFCSPLOWO2_12_FULL_45_10]
MKLVILAGGSGTRLWPLSRHRHPKQIHPIIGDQTLLQKTYQRLRQGFAAQDIYVVTGKDYLETVSQQLPELPASQIISEPCKRDTAAAIGLAATWFYFRNPQEIIATVHADHFIDKEDEYLRLLRLAESVVKQHPDKGVLIGVKPTYPETGYGYIKMNSQFFSLGEQKVFLVESFVEKPDLTTARQYVSQWQYLWNPGYFIWRVDTLLRQYRRWLPEQYQAFVKINRALGTAQESKVIAREFAGIKPVAFDYGILESAQNLVVLPADFVFIDIGNWRTVKDVLTSTGAATNKGEVISLDSANNLIYNFSKRPVACVGVRDMIVVATDDVTLICHEESAQEVKTIVQKLKETGKEEYL